MGSIAAKASLLIAAAFVVGFAVGFAAYAGVPLSIESSSSEGLADSILNDAAPLPLWAWVAVALVALSAGVGAAEARRGDRRDPP